MKIDEVIEQLKAIRDKHGNIDVARKETEMDSYYDIEKIEVFDKTSISKAYVGIK